MVLTIQIKMEVFLLLFSAVKCEMRSIVTVETTCMLQTASCLSDSMKSIEFEAQVLKNISKVQFLMHSFTLFVVFVTLIYSQIIYDAL